MQLIPFNVPLFEELLCNFLGHLKRKKPLFFPVTRVSAKAAQQNTVHNMKAFCFQM